MPLHWPYYFHMARRGLLFWLAARVMLLAGGAAVGTAPVAFSPVTALMLLGFVAALCAVDARLMREHVFQANLGTPVWAPVAVGAGTAALLEAGSAVLLAAIA